MFQVNHVWHSKVTITVGSNNQQARNANCMWWFPLTFLDAVSGTFTSIKDCETLNWSSMMFRRICVIRNLQWILDHGISNFPPSQWCQWWFICGLSSLMAPGQNRKHGWPKVLRGALPCVENQTKIFAWWSNIYDISIWVFWRLACFSHTVVPDELDAGSDQDLWSHLGNEMSTICWWYLANFLSCILWYIMLYTSLYIYIVCILMIIYNINYTYIYYIYIRYVRSYFLITSKLDFQLMIYHLPVPGGGGISEGSAEKLSLGTRDLSVDLLGMTVLDFSCFWAMPVWSIFPYMSMIFQYWHHLRKMMPPNLEFYNRTDSVNIFRISSTSNQQAESPYFRWSYSWSRHLGGFVKPMNQLAIWRKKTGNLEVSNMKRAELVMFHSNT